MKTELFYNGIGDITILNADKGMVLKRKNSNEIYGKEISLGKSYYLDGVLLPEPHIDVPEDFEEIPNPEPENEFEEDVTTIYNEEEN